MSRRITDKDLDAMCEILNKTLGTPTAPYAPRKDGKGVEPQAGNYHIDHAYGGVALHQMSLLGGGGVSDISQMGHVPKRDLYTFIDGMLAGARAARR